MAGDLEIHEDVGYNVRYWRFQRIAWLFLFAVISAAVLGFTGSGVLGKKVEKSADGLLSVEFDRVVRIESSYELKLDFRKAVPGTLRIWADRKYLESMYVQDVLPRPLRIQVDAERVVYDFGTGGESAAINFLINPQKPGIFTPAFGVSDRTSVRFSQVILP